MAMRQRKRQELEATIVSIMRALGHASPDPQVVSHCPGCGSGDVVARSDGNVECSMCTRQFTIAEQPAYSALPGDNAGNGPQQAPPDAAAPQSQHELDLPPVDPQAAAAAPPFVVPEDKGSDDTPPNLDGSKPEEKPKDGNPFAKKSAAEESTCKKCGDPVYKSQYGWEHKAKPGISPAEHRHRVFPADSAASKPKRKVEETSEGEDGLTDFGRSLREQFKTASDDGTLCTKCGYWKATDGDLCETCATEEGKEKTYRTQKGAVLVEADYVLHLALGLHPEVRQAVLGHCREVNV